jgi:hypothetical protein
MTKINRIERVALSGGILGLIFTNPRNAIEKKIIALNEEGWNCHQIIPHATRNFMVFIFQLILLFLTFFLWTFDSGYILLFEKEINTSPKNYSNTNDTPINRNYGDTWICKKCNQENLATSPTCKSCGEYR